jgi:hypothetical protein
MEERRKNPSRRRTTAEAGAASPYLLLVNERPKNAHKTLDDAKAAAQPFAAGTDDLRIELRSAPAPTLAWRYDRDVKGWVETTPE